MQAARSDAAEVRANIAAVGQTRTIAEQQTTNHRRRHDRAMHQRYDNHHRDYRR